MNEQPTESASLREAARAIRADQDIEENVHRISWRERVTWLAVAAWLDATAFEHESDSGNASVAAFFAAYDTAPDHAALAVAKAYLRS